MNVATECIISVYLAAGLDPTNQISDANLRNASLNHSYWLTIIEESIRLFKT